jgi:hypothetical protein
MAEIKKWKGWESLGGVLTSDPVAGLNDDLTLEVFVRGTDNGLHHIWQTKPAGNWSGWEALGGKLTSNIAVSKNALHGLEVFVRGTDNGLHHIWQTKQHGNWSSWEGLGGILTSDPVVGVNYNGALEVFVRGTDNGLHHIWQTKPAGNWSGWQPLGGILTSGPAVGVNDDGTLEVFVRGTDNGLHHIWQTKPGGSWSGWEALGGGLTSNIAVSRKASRGLEVFVRGTDNALWHNWSEFISTNCPAGQCRDPLTKQCRPLKTNEIVHPTTGECVTKVNPTNPIQLRLGRVTGPDYEYFNNGLSIEGKIKSIRNKGQFLCHLSHEVVEDPILWKGTGFQAGEVKIVPFEGMKVAGKWKGHYSQSGPMPEDIYFEIYI